MIASLNQGLTRVIAAARFCVAIRSEISAVAIRLTILLLQVILEVAFTPSAAANAEDMRWATAGVQLDVIAIPMPEVTGVGKQVVHLIRPIARQTHLRDGKFDPGRLLVVRIK